MDADIILPAVFVPLGFLLFYEAGKRKLLEYTLKRIFGILDAANKTAAEDVAGLPESAKQALLDSFMKGAYK
ncbi:MAG: hypothetical protein IKU08_09115 [Clostridia bacterium]|nr:hypothetical protein [Clostridia bacterium]